SNNEIDLAITYTGQFPETYKSTILYSDLPVCMARRGHPLLKRERIKIPDYLKCQHVALVYDELSATLLGDRLLKKNGFEKRNIKLRIRSPLAALSILAQSDMLLTVSETFAHHYSRKFNLDYRKLAKL